MTPPESITVSLEWAKKLKKAGFPQNCPWGKWFYSVHTNEELPSINLSAVDYIGGSRTSQESFAVAPTAEEILRRLPRSIPHEPHPVFLVCEPMNAPAWWIVGYVNVAMRPILAGPSFNGDTLANAASAMYVFLADNKLLPQS